MAISDDFRSYLNERRRAMLIEIAGIERLIGKDTSGYNRAERRADRRVSDTVEREFVQAKNMQIIQRQ